MNLEHLLTKRWKAHTACVSLSACVGVLFLFQSQWMLFVSAWSMCLMWYLANPHCPVGRGWGLPLWHKKCVHGSIALCGLQGETPLSWGTNTYYRNSSCSVSSLSKAMFYPLLNCVVFSLVTPIPRCNRKVFSPPLLTDAQYSAQHVHSLFIIFLFSSLFIQ